MTRILTKGWRPVVAVLIVIVLWEVGVRTFSVEEWFLPAPSTILEESKHVLPTFIPHFTSTLTLSVSGFVIGATVGLIVATFLQLSILGRVAYLLFLVVSLIIPIIVLAPLLVIWFGFVALLKLIVIGLACFFPIAVSALGGLQQSSRELNLYLNMMGASK